MAEYLHHKWEYPEVGSLWELRTIPYPDCRIEILPQGPIHGLVTFRMIFDGTSAINMLAYCWFYAAHTKLEPWRAELAREQEEGK